MTFVTGPIAPENNPTIEPQFFRPSRFQISAISTGPTTTVTTLPSFGVDNNYVVGQLIRFVIPKPFGIQQLNEQQAYVINLPSTNQFTVNIDTSKGYDPFNPSPFYSTTPPSVVAIGDINFGFQNQGRSNENPSIPGSFQNISPSAGG